MGEPVRIGIDLGGTKIEAIALDAQGDELIRRRLPTPQGNYRGPYEREVEIRSHRVLSAGSLTIYY